MVDDERAALGRASARAPARARGRHGSDREDLFAAWRLFFERLARSVPDGAGLRGHAVGRPGAARLHRLPARVVAGSPIFVVTLARPELLDAGRPGAPATRNFTSLYLEPLAESGDGRPPQRARAGASRRAARASWSAPRASRCTPSRRCACSSTAGRSSRRAPSTGPTGTIEALEVPETLHALIAARLDGLSPEERASLQDGRCSARRSRARPSPHLSGLSETELEPILASLTRKEVLGVQADPRSPERGQYGFLQDLAPPRRLRDALDAPTARQSTWPQRRTSRLLADER